MRVQVPVIRIAETGGERCGGNHPFAIDQHQEHADAFNAAAKNMGGQTQTNPDQVLLDVVNKAKPGLTGPGPVVDLAIELENTAGQTYVAAIK